MNIEIGDLVAVGFNPEYATSFNQREQFKEVRCYDIKYNQNDRYIYNIRNVSSLRFEKDETKEAQ